MKTSVMMIGELDYDDIFHGYDDSAGELSEEAHETRVYFEVVTYFFFVALLILMSIIIMNLLVRNQSQIHISSTKERVTCRSTRG